MEQASLPPPDDILDLQVNGYAGVDFNNGATTPNEMHEACRRLREDGVKHILATIITDDVGSMAARLASLAAFRRQDPLVEQVVLGFHIEGPFISPLPGYFGTHPAAAIRPADSDAMKRLLDAAEGLARIVTLAPEYDEGFRVVRLLDRAGVVAAAGHCNPSVDELRGAIDAGLSMFTHFGNGCPAVLPRHDNIIERVLGLADRLFVSMIADGAHVPFVAMRNYLRLIPADRVVIVSDAINAAGCGPGTYAIGDQVVEVGDDLIPRTPDRSSLAGSACTMRRMADHLQRELGVDANDLRRWMVENPRRAIGESAA
ncbi:MAG TPA: N-acetylglucosamine-6-phosphate deacetylase [Planctomycetaceae bacterium]|nr:N-acetylglucosamine-6-phosphate deacetylase [Planctomycetaceae bacterium]